MEPWKWGFKSKVADEGRGGGEGREKRKGGSVRWILGGVLILEALPSKTFF